MVKGQELVAELVTVNQKILLTITFVHVDGGEVKEEV
jgi:hypothetical protein